jgi:hypothetical protein
MPKKGLDTQVVSGKRVYIILEEMNYARHESLQEAISLAQTEQAKDPARKFIVVQVLATIEPVLTSKITRHL